MNGYELQEEVKEDGGGLRFEDGGGCVCVGVRRGGVVLLLISST